MKSGFLNRGIVSILVMFVIPAALVIGGYLLVATQGQIPGGTTTSCETTLENQQFRIEAYAYSAGLAAYEKQTFSQWQNDAWQEVFADTIQAPDDVSCDNNILTLDGAYILHNQKTIALLQGDAWYIQNVCDAPRHEGRCDADALNIADIQITDANHITLTVQQSVVDEYGQPLTENGERRITDEYQLVTDNGGLSWELVELSASN